MLAYKTDKHRIIRKAHPVGQCHWCGDVVIGVTKKKYCSRRCGDLFNKKRGII